MVSLAILLIVIPLVRPMEFYYMLTRDSEQCFEEHLGGQTLVTGEIYYPRSGSLYMRVLNPKNSKILSKKLEGNKVNKYMFTTLQPGRYSVCLEDQGSVITEVKFTLRRGVEEVPLEPEKVVDSKDEFRPVEMSLNNTMKLASDVHKNMGDLRKSGSDQQLLSESINTTVILLGCLSVGIVIASVAVQVWYLKSFFRQKKIL